MNFSAFFAANTEYETATMEKKKEEEEDKKK